MKGFLWAAAIVMMPLPAFGQTLASPAGHDVDVSVAHYRYVEPGTQGISIHGPKIGGGYTGTFTLDARRHWFVRVDARGVYGNASYDGWCSPWGIKPNSASPNGYALDFGDASPCSESGDRDWYVETRASVGKDFIGGKWAVSPYAGVGVRHLSNGVAVPGYRTDTYLYPPLGVTLRTAAGSHGPLSINREFDPLIRGWQTTRGSKLGGGLVPATDTAPAFTIDSISDVSFVQHGGWALRASANIPVAGPWSVEPYSIYWRIDGSPVNDETVTFTVNGVTAREGLGFYEPFNTTREFGVKLGFRFGGAR